MVSENAGSFAVQRRTGKTLAVSQNNELRATFVAKTENTDRRASPMVNVARRYFYPYVGLEVAQIQEGVFEVGRRFSVFQVEP